MTYRQKRQDRVRYAILGYLGEHGPTASFDLTRGLGLWIGTLYPALDRMQRAGELEAWFDQGVDPSHHEKRLYALPTHHSDNPKDKQ